MNSTTFTAYCDWLKMELSQKKFGEVSLKFVIRQGQVVDVRKESIESDHFELTKR